MSFNRQFLEASPLSTSPPASPWRARAEVLRRRPLRFRQIAFVIASVTFLCSFVFLSRYRADDRRVWISLEDEYPSDLQVVDTGGLAAHGGQRLPPQHQHAHVPALAPQVPVPDTLHQDDTHVKEPPKPPEAVVFSLIMFSEDSAVEGAMLMKSILMYTSMPVEFHIVCDEAAQAYLENRVRLITRPAHDILVRFYLLSWQSMADRIDREGTIMTDHSAGVPGLMKLFIHEILPPSVPRAIFIDTDALFISDPALLWDRFAQLAPGAAIAIPTHPEMSAAEWHHANRICSCIMLLDLARLRALRLMDSRVYRAHGGVRALGPQAFRAMYGAPGPSGRFQDVKLGDQGYWYALVSHRPDLTEHLGFEWEVSSCLLDMYLTGLGDDARGVEDEQRGQVHTVSTPQEGEAVLPKMLHFNCLDGTPHYFEWEGWADPENSLTKRWWPAVQYHIGYKWIWLNAHRAKGTLRIEVERDVKFADELLEQELMESRADEQS